MPLLKVFYEDWQMECCGTPFAVGDEVSWALVAYGARARRENAGYGAEARVENHGGPGLPTTGRVHALALVHEEFRFDAPEPVPEEPGKGEGGLVLRSTGRGLEAVPGTLTTVPADRCPKWFGETDLGTTAGGRRVRRTCGALITLDTPDTTHVLHP
ncbi:DUF6578 domain-containing protein [Streptomyces sp. NPDC048288]|uniref:DUF6578 domain-containing protein n=1 Tax=Streptomyces sp. NPDC048288 TaxID=3365529 RepID=UPI003724290B